MFSSQVSIDSNRGAALEVWIEPWGMPIEVAAGSRCRVVAQGSIAGELEVIERGATTRVVYAWPTATVEVFVDEVSVYRCDIAVPGVPEGSSVRTFLGKLFGWDR
jgi:hypothetical protein